MTNARQNRKYTGRNSRTAVSRSDDCVSILGIKQLSVIRTRYGPRSDPTLRRQCSRKRVQQLKKRKKSSFLDFEKKR